MKKSYRKRPGLMRFLEVSLGLYFAAAVLYAIQNDNFATIPFFILFVWGYLYTGVMSLAQTYFSGFSFRSSASAPQIAELPAPSATAAEQV